jgi:hypothetical protein
MADRVILKTPNGIKNKRILKQFSPQVKTARGILVSEGKNTNLTFI